MRGTDVPALHVTLESGSRERPPRRPSWKEQHGSFHAAGQSQGQVSNGLNSKGSRYFLLGSSLVLRPRPPPRPPSTSAAARLCLPPEAVRLSVRPRPGRASTRPPPAQSARPIRPRQSLAANHQHRVRHGAIPPLHALALHLTTAPWISSRPRDVVPLSPALRPTALLPIGVRLGLHLAPSCSCFPRHRA
ncbi:hypothetical protein CDD83_2423 [Cordyceps sp. RAO-2017]|nr:hypothetical protein CDD83_2423 [Cordyceps sp. RAO-2017]